MTGALLKERLPGHSQRLIIIMRSMLLCPGSTRQGSQATEMCDECRLTVCLLHKHTHSLQISTQVGEWTRGLECPRPFTWTQLVSQIQIIMIYFCFSWIWKQSTDRALLPVWHLSLRPSPGPVTRLRALITSGSPLSVRVRGHPVTIFSWPTLQLVNEAQGYSDQYWSRTSME